MLFIFSHYFIPSNFNNFLQTPWNCLCRQCYQLQIMTVLFFPFQFFFFNCERLKFIFKCYCTNITFFWLRIMLYFFLVLYYFVLLLYRYLDIVLSFPILSILCLVSLSWLEFPTEKNISITHKQFIY